MDNTCFISALFAPNLLLVKHYEIHEIVERDMFTEACGDPPIYEKSGALGCRSVWSSLSLSSLSQVFS